MIALIRISPLSFKYVAHLLSSILCLVGCNILIIITIADTVKTSSSEWVALGARKPELGEHDVLVSTGMG